MRINNTPNQLGPIQPEDVPAGQDVVYPSTSPPRQARDVASTSSGGASGRRLLHFEPAYQHAGHYCGRTNHLRRRLRQHATGYSAEQVRRRVVRPALVWAATLHDCDVQVARVFFPQDAGAFERRLPVRRTQTGLRRQKNHPRYCPICNPTLKGASNAT